METLLSFHNDTQLKQDLIVEILRHEKADQIVQGHYGKMNGKWKGCAVGCSIQSYNNIRGKSLTTSVHALYESEFGIPRILARLEDRIFEGMNIEDAKGFPYRFMSAVPVGKNLESVWKKFFIWLLVDEKDGVIKYAKTDQTKKAIADVADLLGKSLISKVTPEQYAEVRRAAWSARNAYASAAAAYASASADAASAAADADADAAASAAADADADAAASAAAAAAYASASADADADAAASAAAAAAYASASADADADAAAYAAADAAYASASAAADAASAAAYASAAADAAADAASAAAYASASAAADAAADAARSTSFKRMGDKLIELLQAA